MIDVFKLLLFGVALLLFTSTNSHFIESGIAVDVSEDVTFYVALKHVDVPNLKNEFLAVSNPSSSSYGKFLTLRQIQTKYGSSLSSKRKLIKYFKSLLPTAKVLSGINDIITITTTVEDIETIMNVKLAFYQQQAHTTNQKQSTALFLRSKDEIVFPHDIAELIVFTSLNSPIHASSRELYYKKTEMMTQHRNKKKKQQHHQRQSYWNIENSTAIADPFINITASDINTNSTNTTNNNSTTIIFDKKRQFNISVHTGNSDAIVGFHAICSDGSKNTQNPPCSDDTEVITAFTVTVTSYVNGGRMNTTAVPEYTNPFVFEIPYENIYCSYTSSKQICDGNVTATSGSCLCHVKISPLPKYKQLRATVETSFFRKTNTTNITANINTIIDIIDANAAATGSLSAIIAAPSIYLGDSPLFVLTDTATASFISNLYHIPSGLSVNHGSNQSVVEFYHEFYSNDDLSKFLFLSGLPTASIPEATHVFGNLLNNQSQPGGEAQLDVEYIMALARDADTYFYSFADLNPYNLANEGFLAYLDYVSNQEYPPLVHSLSYGDIEASVFNVTYDLSYAYGVRCEEEFMKLGLRGITLIFASGDDGIGGYIIRDDPETACQRSRPEWPASSAYVTTVGGTQLTDKYLPVCNQAYSASAVVSSKGHYSDLQQQELFECDRVGETVCSSATGGLITSGGGFSDVSVRSTDAPWQAELVDHYLAYNINNTAVLPPTTYFNTNGRGYPDVSAYASNYFVYLNDKITRESGTSASTPVFAAMVTLWNDMRLAYGRPPLGFIAPLMYHMYVRHPEAFADITTGDNACGVGHSSETVNCCQYAFGAAPGWDAVTGLGSPNFHIIANLILNSSIPFPAVSASVAESMSANNSAKEFENASKNYVNSSYVSLIIMSFVLAMLSFLSICFLFFVYICNIQNYRSRPEFSQIDFQRLLANDHNSNNNITSSSSRR